VSQPTPGGPSYPRGTNDAAGDQGDAGPPSADDLNGPAFLAYLGGLGQLPIRPDPEDFGQPKRGAAGGSGGDAAEEYPQAHARKAVRLYLRWKSGR
jgi:hypothetical protein